MKRAFFVIGLFLFLAMVLAGCGSARRGEPLTGAFEPQNEVAARGQLVFMKYCNQCHPKGEAGLGPSLNNKPLPGFLMKFQVRNGLGAMPSFPPSHISDQELDDLIAYLKALRHHKAESR
ncbi:MAG: cytochrome c [Alphaproteobacteria bacterium]|uniref:Cytochrome c n=1 Tax=Candidatus Nitrobium versatile TaxID=2884831 RepID=A0A953M386_9BACT|nr:cytochrome c [Candidatus Nitrobium versatile]